MPVPFQTNDHEHLTQTHLSSMLGQGLPWSVVQPDRQRWPVSPSSLRNRWCRYSVGAHPFTHTWHYIVQFRLPCSHRLPAGSRCVWRRALPLLREASGLQGTPCLELHGWWWSCCPPQRDSGPSLRLLQQSPGAASSGSTWPLAERPPAACRCVGPNGHAFSSTLARRRGAFEHSMPRPGHCRGERPWRQPLGWIPAGGRLCLSGLRLPQAPAQPHRSLVWGSRWVVSATGVRSTRRLHPWDACLSAPSVWSGYSCGRSRPHDVKARLLGQISCCLVSRHWTGHPPPASFDWGSGPGGAHCRGWAPLVSLRGYRPVQLHSGWWYRLLVSEWAMVPFSYTICGQSSPEGSSSSPRPCCGFCFSVLPIPDGRVFFPSEKVFPCAWAGCTACRSHLSYVFFVVWVHLLPCCLRHCLRGHSGSLHSSLWRCAYAGPTPA